MFNIDLFNHEIIGYAAGQHKDAMLVYKAFSAIDRSLNKKGCPYDNAVTEATFKIVKMEFAFNKIFNSFEELEYLLFDYVNWYNNKRIHGSLDYLTPMEYREMMSDKKVS